MTCQRCYVMFVSLQTYILFGLLKRNSRFGTIKQGWKLKGAYQYANTAPHGDMNGANAHNLREHAVCMRDSCVMQPAPPSFTATWAVAII